jgi:uracil-DNA glycosylase
MGLFLFREYNTLGELELGLSKCTKCQYGIHSKKVGGLGPSPSLLMVVGQHPAPKEVQEGKPFQGA